MLWLALHLPALSLESFAATRASAGDDDAETPIALVDDHRISAANAAALAKGVKPGLKRATALALAPRIVLGQADAARDAEAIQPIAHAALAFTPNVSLQPPTEPGAAAHTVLLEVRSSLRFFGGVERLCARLLDAVQPFGHALRLAQATTAQGAAILARVDPPPSCPTLAQTRDALQEAPVWLLGPGQAHWEALQGMGLRTLGDLASLPRAGLARRFGERLLVDLDAAFGRRPDPREPLVLPRLFESRLELFARADSAEQVLYGASVLLGRLIAWLSAQHAFVRRFRLLMHHESRWQQGDRMPLATALEVALAEPSRDPRHLIVLLRERLGHLRLPAPTLELALQAEDIVRRAAPNDELFPTRKSEDEGLTRLIERLQARLGAAQVRHLSAVEDHRPERASTLTRADAARKPATATRRSSRRELVAAALGSGPPPDVAAAPAASTRPVWIEPQGEPLQERGARPLLDGQPLSLLCGPERIEAGWWDAGLAERDYFVAEAADGALVWIYRARLPIGADADGWFLQGRFG